MNEKRVRGPASIADIEAQIERLKERKRKLQAKAADRFAKAALDAGLIDIDIADDELKSAFDEMARRFRKSATAASQSSNKAA